MSAQGCRALCSRATTLGSAAAVPFNPERVASKFFSAVLSFKVTHSRDDFLCQCGIREVIRQGLDWEEQTGRTGEDEFRSPKEFRFPNSRRPDKMDAVRLPDLQLSDCPSTTYVASVIPLKMRPPNAMFG